MPEQKDALRFLLHFDPHNIDSDSTLSVGNSVARERTGFYDGSIL